MINREKRLEKIRSKAVPDGLIPIHPDTIRDLLSDIRFLLKELERKGGAVREVYEGNTNMRSALQDAANEIKKLREERDKYREEAMNERELTEDIVAERENLAIENERLQQDREKLIESLNGYLKELDKRCQKAYQNHVIDSDSHQLGMAEAYEIAEYRLREILKDIEVTVDE